MNTLAKTAIVTAASGLVLLGGVIPAVAGTATSTAVVSPPATIQCGIFTNHGPVGGGHLDPWQA